MRWLTKKEMRLLWDLLEEDRLQFEEENKKKRLWVLNYLKKEMELAKKEWRKITWEEWEIWPKNNIYN